MAFILDVVLAKSVKLQDVIYGTEAFESDLNIITNLAHSRNIEDNADYIHDKQNILRWHLFWMSFLQNQLNFAIWCALTGCGGDFNKHLKTQV